MGSLQGNLEQLFCPLIDSTLIAAIVSDHPDFDSCFEILSSLVEEAEAERDIENEISSGNSSSNLRNSSSGEPGDGSTTSIEYSTYSPSVEDELAYTTDYEDYEYPKGNTEFLKNMFPMIPESRVNNLLREKDNNVEMVVDVILNEMYLQSEQEDDFSYSRSTATLISNSDADNSLITDVRNKYRKKKRRKPQRKQNIIFQNNGHRPNSNNSSSSLSSSSTSTSSYWTSSSRNPESLNELIDDNKLCQLMDIFPNHNFENIKQTLVNCNGEVQNATEILSSGALNDSQRHKVIKLISHTSEHQDTHLQNKERRDSIQNYTNDTNSYEMPIKKIYDDDEIVDYEDDHDPDHCHEEAIKCFKERDESFKKAAQSYRRGQGSVASYHSEEGWRLDAEMKKWKLRAARSLVKKHSKKTQNEYVLDLHGCFVTEAIMIVKEWLNDWYPKRMRSASQMKPSQMKPLKIITGKGNHSPNGVAKLPNAINKFLIGDNWNITKHMGHVLVHGLKQ